MLTQDYVRQLFDYNAETGSLSWRARPSGHFSSESYCARWNSTHAGNEVRGKAVNGYLRVNIGGVVHLAHRVIWLHVHGYMPDYLDHVNGRREDNRLTNLRPVKQTDNARNACRPTTNTSGVVGVSFDSTYQTWHAYIGVGEGKRKSLGYFITKEEAAAARKGAERVLGYHANHGRTAA